MPRVSLGGTAVISITWYFRVGSCPNYEGIGLKRALFGLASDLDLCFPIGLILLEPFSFVATRSAGACYRVVTEFRLPSGRR